MLGDMVKKEVGQGFIFHAIIPHGRHCGCNLISYS